MPSVIRVTVRYEDRSKSFLQEYNCVDAQPTADVIMDCEKRTLATWLEAGNGGRHLVTSTEVRVRGMG